LEKFREMIAQQGGDVNIIDNYDLLPLSPVKMEVKADRDGYITKMDTAMIGRASQETGAGRMFKGQPLDFGAGIIMKKRTGGAIATGETLAIVYSESKEKCDSAAVFLKKAITIAEKPATEQPPLIWKIIRQED
ncbi:MAG: pyrimidine-nucleoside phosphorylase, partial [Anaerotignum sp.]|nr:pyrimidine-nucleoside phosphorylase [Anaerotignum sp.]